MNRFLLWVGVLVGSVAQGQTHAGVQTPWFAWVPASNAPAFARLSVDSLGEGRLASNPVFARRLPQSNWTWRAASATQWVATAAGAAAPGWEVFTSDRALTLRTRHVPESGNAPFHLVVDQHLNHATFLARLPEPCRATLPGVLHFPDLGTFRVSCSVSNASVHYDARRRRPDHFVQVDFPPADAAHPVIDYRLEVTLIHPEVPGLATDRRFDGFRRNWINALQMHARWRLLANHSSSDSCAFCIYEYADIAACTPPLAPGLTALDLVRDTLDRYLDGFVGYGMPGYRMFDAGPAVSRDPCYLDTFPSLLIAASVYARGSGDTAWMKRRYAGLKAWADLMLAMDRDGNGLLEYPYSGNSGSWPREKSVARRPANWWDTIGFGHEDAYSNALAYRALREMALTARTAGADADADGFTRAADRLRDAYGPAFLHPQTGRVAGWRSADGELHDHAFTFVNGIAVAYGLLPRDQANAVLDRLLATMKEVGYTRFDLGLPGNLVPVPLKDYVHLDKRWGGGEREDNTDGFQIYENGGATACFSYFLIAALYRMDRTAEADAILLPMLDAFARGDFQGRAPNGMSKDWKAWDGTPWGYEGFLVDGYYTLLAVLDRASPGTFPAGPGKPGALPEKRTAPPAPPF